MSQYDPHSDAGDAASEELVAYLDDELPLGERLRVEQRLVGDPEYRGRLESLQLAWECLDELPQETLDDAFAQSTMEMVALAAARDVEQEQAALPAGRSVRRVLTAVTLLGCLLAGAMLAAALAPDANRRLLAELPLIERLDLYLQIDDLAYLRRLHASGLFAEADEAAEMHETAGEVYPLSGRFPPAADLQQRRQYIADLSPHEKAQLGEKLRRFDALPAARQQRLRELHEELTRDSQADELVATLQAHHEWIKGLSPGERNDLSALDDSQRLQRVAEVLASQRERAARARWARAEQERRMVRLNQLLPQQDVEALVAWFEDHLLSDPQALLGMLKPQERERIEQHLKSLSPRQQAAVLLTAWHRLHQSGPPEARGPVLAENDLKQLVERLSPQTRGRLIGMGGEQRKLLVRTWLAAAARSRMPGQPHLRLFASASSEELEEFFEKHLTSQDREYLLSLPREEMERELRRLHLQGPATGLARPDARPARPDPPELERPPRAKRLGPAELREEPRLREDPRRRPGDRPRDPDRKRPPPDAPRI